MDRDRNENVLKRKLSKQIDRNFTTEKHVSSGILLRGGGAHL